jgi:Kef-type K+ transport system membrane component KefB
MQAFLELALILTLATSVSFLLQRMKLPLILGYILTGMLAGPFVFGWINDTATVEIFSKLGITALLFIVGLNLTPSSVRDVGRVAAAVGLGQIFITTLLGFGLVWLLGFRGLPALFLAIALTFSSTIIALKSMQDRRDLGKLYARIAIGVLLVQDLVATALLIGLSSTAGGASVLALGWAIIKLFALAAGLWFVARFVLPRLTPIFADSQEFLLLFSVAWGMGVATLFQLSGFSIEIGALAAGIALSTSPYHLEISAKMKLLRDFFLVLFFVLLGAQLAFGNSGDLWLPVLILSAYVLIGNPLIVNLIMGFMGYRRKTAFFTGLTMAQVSEFSLVFLLLGRTLGYVDDRVVECVDLLRSVLPLRVVDGVADFCHVIIVGEESDATIVLNGVSSIDCERRVVLPFFGVADLETHRIDFFESFRLGLRREPIGVRDRGAEFVADAQDQFAHGILGFLTKIFLCVSLTNQHSQCIIEVVDVLLPGGLFFGV